MTLFLDRRKVRVAVALGAVAAMAAACGGHSRKASSGALPSTTVTPSTTQAKPSNLCPLTGLPAPHGRVPQRPALAVKVENLPEARPQYGLDAADVIYEEPVEGGITRFIVIYQCHDTSRIEPIRSGRFIDPWIVRQFGAHPLFAYAGAIQPVVAEVDSSTLIDVGIDRGSGYWRDPNRPAPHNLVNSTADLYASGAAQGARPLPPPPVFTYGPLPAGVVPANNVNIAYQYADSDVVWQWHSGPKLWFRTYEGTQPADLADGAPITAANVIVMKVIEYPSGYVEDPTGAHENLLVLTGSGPAEVFRNGSVITGTWKRPSLSRNTQYLDSAGDQIPLSPGVTWVELVPTTVAVSYGP